MALLLLTGLAAQPASAQWRRFPRLRYVDQKQRPNPRNEFEPEPNEGI